MEGTTFIKPRDEEPDWVGCFGLWGLIIVWSFGVGDFVKLLRKNGTRTTNSFHRYEDVVSANDY